MHGGGYGAGGVGVRGRGFRWELEGGLLRPLLFSAVEGLSWQRRGYDDREGSPRKPFGILQRLLGESRSKILCGSLDSPSSYAEYAGSLPAQGTLGLLGQFV